MGVRDETALGAYLSQVRYGLGCETVSEFLKKYPDLPFTGNYYRDVEAGRKTLSIESAVKLAEQLKLSDSESVDFYWHYFHDVLPDSVHKLLFGLRSKAPKELEDINRVREYDSRLHRRALALSRYEREFIVDDSIAELFLENIDLLPIMTYLYMVKRASCEEIRTVCRNIGVKFDKRVRDFLDPISTKTVVSGKEYFSRLLPVLRMPRSSKGVALKNEFLMWEIQQSVNKEDCSEFFPIGGSFKTSSMFVLRPHQLEAIQNRIVDLLAEVEVSSKSDAQLENQDAVPYFFSLVISGRPEYDGRPGRRAKGRDNSGGP